MTVEYTNRWFRLSVEFFGIRSRPALRKYAIGYAEDSHEIKHRIVRSICAKVTVWDVETGQAMGAPLKHDGEVSYAEFSPDGRRVLTASTD